MFNLSSSRQFPSQQGEGGIWCKTDRGPAFGFKNNLSELKAQEPFNVDNKCYSDANCSGYRISAEGDKNMLTNKKDGGFTITEIEVWQIVNVENLVLNNNK